MVEEGLRNTVEMIVQFYDEYYGDNGQDEIAKLIALAKMHMKYDLETEQMKLWECKECPVGKSCFKVSEKDPVYCVAEDGTTEELQHIESLGYHRAPAIWKEVDI